MTAAPPAHRSVSALASPRPFLAGVEVGPSLIRAGVFSDTFELIGKAKVSTKNDRGTVAVLERIARCVEYAADECDLRIEDIRALGVGVPGQVDPERGLALSAGSLGWKDVPVRNALEKFLRMPVFVENQCRLGTLGVFAREIDFPTKRFAACSWVPKSAVVA
jgi:glucokinase